MADYDPAQPVTWDEDGESYDVEDDAQDEPAQDNSEQDQEEDGEQAEYSVDQTSRDPTDFPSAGGSTNDGGDNVDDEAEDAEDAEDAGDDGGDYDPASVTSSLAAPGPLSQAPAPPKQSPKPTAKAPRIAGGFIVGDSDSEEDEDEDEDDDDDDDDDDPAPAYGAPGPAANAQPALARSPLRNTVIAQVPTETSHSAHASQAPSAANTTPLSELRNDAAAAAPPALAPSASVKPKPPQDRIATYEERIRDDPRGATNEWLLLIDERRNNNDVEALRQVYERFLAIFPQAADIWVQYVEMELSRDNFQEAEAIFAKCLLDTPNVNLWTKYLDYIRRRNDLTTDSSGKARQTISQVYEFVFDNIGQDKDSGRIWADYIQFLKMGPGRVGGSDWKDQQKMDQLRKAYQNATSVPIENVNTLWKEYDQFEMSLNKFTGRKYLADRSPSYMAAKSATTALKNITQGLHRSNIPRLPPAPGFDGDQEYMEQVELWKKWIAWEKTDPLDIKDEQSALLQKRILYAYTQALMALRFWPELWADAAQWCIENNVTKDNQPVGLKFLVNGINANPESVLLALRHADFIESTYPTQENDDSKIAKGEAVREPYKKVLDTLYATIKSVKDREAATVAQIEERAALDVPPAAATTEDDDDDYNTSANALAWKAARDKAKDDQIKAIQQVNTAQIQLLSRTLSFVWIALIRAMRRIQGKGNPNSRLGGMRQAFTDARQRGRLTSDVYVAAAQLEWTIYKDNAGAKIFERGTKLFPEDENFTLEYIKYLHSKDDFTNARVLFETVVNRLAQKPELAHKAKPLYAYFHKYESQFGELAQIAKLEQRMAELFPEDPKLSYFNSRFSTDKFDPIAARIIISPMSQLRPKSLNVALEQLKSLQNSPRPPPAVAQLNSPRPTYLQSTNSPKRPFPVDDFDDVNPPRKMMRGDHGEFQRGASPLKGAAGRRLDQQRRMQGQGATMYSSTPASIARDITFLIGLIPPAHTYHSMRFNPGTLTRVLTEAHIPGDDEFRSKQQGGGGPTSRASHHRQISGDYHGQYDYQHSRDSPNPPGGGRPMSPYPDGDASGRGRLAPASATYRQSSLRPGSSGSYEPPPPVFTQQPPSYGHGHPPQPQFDPGAWQQQQQQYGAPPPQFPGPPVQQQGYAPPPPQHLGYGQPTAPPPQGYPRYQY